ncbi:hypothetical protein H4CHR_00695 [Variovorax sp. PBS-H4]|uniref:hypothetical protein n=1 Tax=Variovorax sp. PBS-H4 TaxID=434008 RepID=UPI0013170118|nr:hypothetical protein [Variovorax sp. PBS-H4]VTU20979.1 hypothetical protein H4CHR_00695 [Variovorax sp. PBS-H4]
MNSVLLVIDQRFGSKVELLPYPCPLWIIESEANRGALKNSSSRNWPLTWFPIRSGESATEVFARISYSLDQHHNEFAQDPPYDVLDVYGLPPNVDMLPSVRDLGFVSQMKMPSVTRFLKLGAEESAKAPK